MLNLLHKLKKEVHYFREEHLYIGFLTEAFLLTLLIELLSRKSLLSLLSFIGGHQFTFWCNAMIIFLTLSLSTLAGSYRRFAHVFISMIWIVLGVVNAVVLKFRMTPFSAEDFSMIPSLFRIAKNYLTTGSLILLIIALLLLAAGIVFMWRQLPKDRIRKNWFHLAGYCAAIAVSCYVFLNMGMQTQAISTDFMNLADAYEEYGFAYCFSTSIVDVGIDKPDQYSAQLLEDIAAGMESQEEQKIFAVTSSEETIVTQQGAAVPDNDIKTTSAGETEGADASSVSDSQPNIIMIQLESFFDPYYLTDYSFSEDPIPVFRSIKENKEQFASGFLTVPVVGAGTSNTEFEILTGMSCDYFGAGEYPYNTVLKETAVEAVPQILRQYGYTSTAVHNNTGTFYNRHLVFANMGFDRFIPLEYMYDMELTPNNWHKDAALTQIMMDSLAESSGPDFIYTITVQSHGRYPSTKVLDDPVITVSCVNEMANTNALEYYVNMIREVDLMISDLLQQLTALDEPTILVMFGDHLPALGFDADDLSQSSLYQTEYVIWDNFDLKISGGDLQAESLSTGILQLFGLDQGIIPKFHEAYDGTEEYSEYLEILEYDMLYGDGYVFRSLLGEEETEAENDVKQNGAREKTRFYSASDLLIEYRPISIEYMEYRTEDGTEYLYITGENFNEYSRIVLNGKPKTTDYIDHQTLRTKDIPKNIEEAAVGQFDENAVQLGALVYAELSEEG